jgi:hypothetical protein
MTLAALSISFAGGKINSFFAVDLSCYTCIGAAIRTLNRQPEKASNRGA